MAALKSPMLTGGLGYAVLSNIRPPELVENKPIPKTMEEAGERRLAELRSVRLANLVGFSA